MLSALHFFRTASLQSDAAATGSSAWHPGSIEAHWSLALALSLLITHTTPRGRLGSLVSRLPQFLVENNQICYDMSSDGVNISSDDRGPWINIVTWIFLVVTVLAVAVKGFSKWTLLHKFQYDDLLVAAAAVRPPSISYTLPWCFSKLIAELACCGWLRSRRLITSQGRVGQVNISPEYPRHLSLSASQYIGRLLPALRLAWRLIITA